MKMGSPEEFFRFLDRLGGAKHTYTGELYFSSHRGTYTSQARIKKYNRACELAMREMEWWSAQAVRRGMDYDLPRADRLWKLLLFQQFHDILPGSSIARVCEEAQAAFLQILKEAGEMTQQALSWLLQEKEGEAAVTVLNSLSFPRQAMVSLPETFCHGAVTEDGKRLPVQYTDGVLKTLVSLPAGGAVVLSAAAEEKGEPQNGICGSREGDRNTGRTVSGRAA